MEIPFDRLAIPAPVRQSLRADAPRAARMALAQGLLPTTTDVQMAICYILATREDEVVAEAARKTLANIPKAQLLGALNHRTHPKIVEFLAEFRPPDSELDEKVMLLRSTNDRAARLVAARASAELCDRISINHERLLMTPDICLDLHGNPRCSDAVLQKTVAFLRMHRALPDLPAERPFKVVEKARQRAPQPEPLAQDMSLDLDQEIEAALAGQQSPALLGAQESGGLEMFDLDKAGEVAGSLGGFRFDFADEESEFGWELTQERSDGAGLDGEDRLTIEQYIESLSVGKRIKLAYLGNKAVREKLIRDQNSIVAVAVVKSGRLSDGEVISYCGNRNLSDDVIRELSTNREFVRKYPVKVALVNNPKTPPSVAMSFISTLQKRDLQQLARNRNVPSVVFQTAQRMYRTKYRNA